MTGKNLQEEIRTLKQDLNAAYRTSDYEGVLRIQERLAGLE